MSPFKKIKHSPGGDEESGILGGAENSRIPSDKSTTPLTTYLQDRVIAGENFLKKPYPYPSMYGIVTYMWLILVVNVGKIR